MKGTLALLLIAGGLYIVYEVLNIGSSAASSNSSPTGQFTGLNIKTPDQVGIVDMGQRAPGGAAPPPTVPFIPPPVVGPGEIPKDPTTGSPVGGGMVSIQSRIRRVWE